MNHSQLTNDSLIAVANELRHLTVILNGLVSNDIDLHMLETETVRSFLRRATFRLERMAGVRDNENI